MPTRARRTSTASSVTSWRRRWSWTSSAVNLGLLEIVGRRLILLEEAHSVDAGAPSFEGWEHWLGSGERRAGVLIPPEVSRYVAKRVGDEAAVAKERRKAQEERRFGKNRKKDDQKGKGKGDQPP